MAHYFTADCHFGDEGTRQFFRRPFTNAEAMDRAMLDKLSTLSADDDLWMIGDIAACDTPALATNARRCLLEIKARKHLVRGNHDPDVILSLADWVSVDDLVEVELDGRLLVMCHYPLVTWNRVRQGAIHLFGHVHDRWQGARGQVNVGVDLWKFGPVSLDEVELAALVLDPSPLAHLVEGY